MDVGCWVGVVMSCLMLACSHVGVAWIGMVGRGSQRLEVREGREWDGSLFMVKCYWGCFP